MVKRSRCTFPDRVYEILERRCSLGPGSRVLEIGPGTGQATRQLLQRGAAVTAVELDSSFAARLRSAFAGSELEVVDGAFEDVALPDESFDLVAGGFGPVLHEVLAWTGRHTATEIRSLFASFSAWLALPDNRRAKALDRLERLAIDDFGGVVERPYLTALYLAPRL